MKYVADEVYWTEEHGEDSFGHWEEEELSDDQVKEAVMDYLWDEHFRKYFKSYIEAEPIVESIYKDLDCRGEIEEMFAEEIAEYYGGRTV